MRIEWFERIARLKVCRDCLLQTPRKSNICVLFVVWVHTDRDYQQGQRASSSVSTHSVRGWGPAGCDPGGETGLEWGAGEEANVRGDLQTSETQSWQDLQLSYRAKLATLQYNNNNNCVSSLSHCSSRALQKGRRQTLLTPCCACWSSTHPTLRTWSGRGQRSWR